MTDDEVVQPTAEGAQTASEGLAAEGEEARTRAEAATATAGTTTAAEGADIAELQQRYDALRNDYVRLMADFDNFRKNTLKEKQSLLKYGSEEMIKKLLPVVDDVERAIAALNHADDMEAVREGVQLIYAKFATYLEQNGVTPIPAAQGDAFDDSLHDAMTMFPAPTPELKGKIVDCVTKGYKYGDKVIRYAKVVVGQ